MSRETKSGLMLGLSFIVCFAVILSNRGGMSPMDTEAAVQQLLAERNSRALARAGSSLSFSAPAVRDVRSIIPSEQGGWHGMHDHRGDFAGGHASPGVDNGIVGQQLSAGHQTVMMQPNHGGGLDNGRLLSARALPEPVDDEESSWPGRRVVADRSSSQMADRGRDDGFVSVTGNDVQDWAGRGQEISSPVHMEPARGDAAGATSRRDQTYVVQKGDTLWGIVKQFYGEPTEGRITEVYEANKDVMPSKDTVVVGRMIRLPGAGQNTLVAMSESGSPAEAAPAKRSPTTAPLKEKETPKSKKPEFRWYQVAAGDRYVKIAEKELGDGNRWRELFEMNKEIFPDPSQIRSGVRIKLPVEETR